MPERASETIARCRRLALATERPGGTTRLFLSPAMQEAHSLLRAWMEAAGMRVRVDAAGNLRGLYPGRRPDAPVLLIGSHLDTVPNAGAFDGVLGVAMGIAMVEALQDERLPFAVEVIGFSEEEGVRFGTPFLGSLAVVGEMDAATLALTDAAGVSVREALVAFGLGERSMEDARLAPGAFGYLEFHIEQGPVLEAEGCALGVVEAIAGQTRLELRFTGQANHAGTTPMHLRRDALAAAAAWMAGVERHARERSGLVATVGRIAVAPGAGNVVPGEAIVSLDVRHADDAAREEAVAAMLSLAEAEAGEREVRVAAAELLRQAAVPMHPGLVAGLHAAAGRAGLAARAMVSGAGHDAMVLARRIPAAMLFLRSPGGLSHHPEESVLVEDVADALAVGMEFLGGLCATPFAASDGHR